MLNEKSRKNKPYFEIKNLLESEGYEVLNLLDDFEGASKTKMRFKCKFGHENESRCSHIRSGTRCKQCGFNKIAKERRIEPSDILVMIKNNNYKFINFVGEYKNRNSKVKIECENGHIKTVMASGIIANNGCSTCINENKKGSNSVHWKGGRRTLYHQLRTVIQPWRKKSLEDKNYTCQITGDNKGGILVVHHPYNFYKILDETLYHLNLPLKENIGEYSNEDLLAIENLCLNNHYKYGLGVVMTEETHILFHKIYGKKNNTYEQIVEFKRNYHYGKFNNIIS